MAQVQLHIAGRNYTVTCQDGEEQHLDKLAAIVDEKVQSASGGAELTESRALLFASLMMADDLYTVKHDSGAGAPAAATAPEQSPVTEESLAALEKLADRAEALANSLER